MRCRNARRPWAGIGAAAGLMLILASCSPGPADRDPSGAAPESGPATATALPSDPDRQPTAGQPTVGGTPSRPPLETGYEGKPPVEITPTRSGGPTGTGPRERTLTNGGPTLDNSYPSQSYEDLAYIPSTSYCGYISNGSARTGATVPVVITRLSAVDQRPAGSRAFTVDDDCRNDYVPAGVPGTPTVYQGCVGRTLPPWQASPAVCWMNVRVADRSGNRSTRVRIDFAAVCTASTGDPCRRVAADRPSPSSPVTVRWSSTRTVWRACFVAHSEGHFGPDRDGDRCPDPPPGNGGDGSGTPTPTDTTAPPSTAPPTVDRTPTGAPTGQPPP